MRKRRYRKFPAELQFGRPAYPEPTLQPQLSWEDLKPLLLRGAGVLGLVGFVVALLSSDLMFTRSEPAQASGTVVGEEQSVPVQEQAVALPVERKTAPAQPVIRQAAALPRRPAHQEFANPEPVRLSSPEPLVQPVASLSQARRPAAPDAAAAVAKLPPPAEAPEPVLVARAPQVEQDAAVEQESPAAALPAPVQSAIPAPAPLSPPGVAESASAPVQPEPDPTASLSSELAMLTSHSFLLPDSGATEVTLLAGIPRLPSARPAPPAKVAAAKPTKAASTRKRSGKGPSAAPPKCGSKKAKWRYVKGTPTWYCR